MVDFTGGAGPQHEANLYHLSMQGTYRNKKGEHFKHLGWEGEKAVLRSLATDKKKTVTIGEFNVLTCVILNSVDPVIPKE